MTYAKVDANQSKIVSALRNIGAFVHSTAAIGKGFPDIVVGYKAVWYLMEIKDGTKPPSARKLTEDEEKWHKAANQHAPVHIVESIEQAMGVIGV